MFASLRYRRSYFSPNQRAKSSGGCQSSCAPTATHGACAFACKLRKVGGSERPRKLCLVESRRRRGRGTNSSTTPRHRTCFVPVNRVTLSECRTKTVLPSMSFVKTRYDSRPTFLIGGRGVFLSRTPPAGESVKRLAPQSYCDLKLGGWTLPEQIKTSEWTVWLQGSRGMCAVMTIWRITFRWLSSIPSSPMLTGGDPSRPRPAPRDRRGARRGRNYWPRLSA